MRRAGLSRSGRDARMGSWTGGISVQTFAIGVLLAVPGALPQAAPRDLKAFFLRTCATCHGADGSGRSPTGQRLVGRALADAKWQARQKDSDLVKVIYLGKGAMPGYKGQLTEDEVKQMVADVVRPLALKK